MTYKSNIKDVFQGLSNKLNKAIDEGQLQRTVAAYLFASNLRRVHNEGKGVDEGRIGRYSTSPALYVSPNRSPKKFPTKGKRGENKFKNGKLHKTGYFASYKDYRGKIGRVTNLVNLQLSGKLKLDFALEANGKGWIIGFRSEYGDSVSRGNEARFGKLIWGVTKSDSAYINNTLIPEFLNKTIK